MVNALAIIAAIAQNNPAAALVRTQVGTWDCTITSPDTAAVQRFSVVWVPFGDGFVKGFARVPRAGKAPGYTANFTFGYDTARGQWVNVYADTRGRYQLSRSGEGPRETSLKFHDAYPVEPSDEPSLVDLGPSITTYDNTWVVSGHLRSNHEVCNKQETSRPQAR